MSRHTLIDGGYITNDICGIRKLSISQQKAVGKKIEGCQLVITGCKFKNGTKKVVWPLFQDIIENSSGIWRGDIQEQRGTFEARGLAAYRGWIMRLARKMGFVAGALFFCFVFFWAGKRKWKLDLEPQNPA